MSAYFWGALAVLVIAGGIAVRLRLRERRHGSPHALDDDAVRRIEAVGRLRTAEEEPLDQDEIDEEERRFWEETWDEPEEY